MLYENETINPLYDPETGLDADEALIRRSKMERNNVIQVGRDLENMKSSPGWKKLSEFLTANIDKYTSLLVYEQDEKKIYRLQEAVKSYSNVLNAVEQAIFEANSLEQEQTLQSEANLKE